MRQTPWEQEAVGPNPTALTMVLCRNEPFTFRVGGFFRIPAVLQFVVL